MIFPEAVWNLSENRIILNCFSGTVRAAIETNAVVVCTAIERYQNRYIINRSGYLDFQRVVFDKYGESFQKLSEEDKKAALIDCNRILRDTLATRLMEIWFDHAEKYGIEKRSELSDLYWSGFISSLVSEWPGYKMSDNVEQQYYTKSDIEYLRTKESFQLLIPSIQNAFLFNKRLSSLWGE